MSADPIAVLEAAYAPCAGDEDWLAGVLEKVAALTGAGLGCYAHFVDASDPRRLCVSAPLTTRLRAPIDVVAANAAMSEDDVRVFYGTKSVDTASHRGGRGGCPPHDSYRRFFRPAGAEDVLGIIAVDARGIGAVLAVPLPRFTRLSRGEAARYARVAAHVSAGLRLRRALAATTDDGGEAILTPTGRVEHATDAAKGERAREALRRMAVAIDRARGPLRQGDGDAALEAWTALACGRWTLLDHFDRDGRRYLVARRNEPALAQPLSLTPRERQVIAYVALGRSNKLIAYELGLAPSTVSELVASAQAKLGLKSRAEAPRVLGRLVREAERSAPAEEGAQRPLS